MAGCSERVRVVNVGWSGCANKKLGVQSGWLARTGFIP